jgi:hypothetical protein
MKKCFPRQFEFRWESTEMQQPFLPHPEMYSTLRNERHRNDWHEIFQVKFMKPISDSKTTANSPSFFKKAKTELNRIRKITLRKLAQCKQTGKSLFISSTALGEGQYLSFVEDIYRNGTEEIVVLKWYDQNNLMSLTHVFIEEILSVNFIDNKKRTVIAY